MRNKQEIELMLENLRKLRDSDKDEETKDPESLRVQIWALEWVLGQSDIFNANY